MKFFKVENIIEKFGTDELTLSWNNGISILFESGLDIQQRLRLLDELRYRIYIRDPIENIKLRS